MSFLELLTLITAGRIAPDCLVWGEGGEPRQAGSIEELFDVFQSKARFAVPAGSGPLAPNLPAWGLFWRAIVYGLGLALIVPAPWAGKWFHGWLAGRISLPNGQRLFLETSFGACWFIFVAIGLAAIAPPIFHGHTGVQIIANLASLFAGFLLTGWFSRSLRSEDGALKVAFEGGFLPYFGWCLLIALSVVTVIGWAWVVKYWMRWICRETRGSHRFEFVATGWDILWRTLVVALGCMLIVTIPWLFAWFYNWYISRIVVTPAVTIAAERGVAARRRTCAALREIAQGEGGRRPLSRFKPMPLTFAYGSNMDAQAMAQRCPRGKMLGRARLPRHRVGLMPDGYATLVPDAGAIAHGVLWDVTFGELATLDRYEGDGYVKVSQPVLREVGAPVRALIYFGKNLGEPGRSLGRAPGDYMEKIVAAAVEAGLPGEHVDFLRRLGGEDLAPPRRFRAIKNPNFL